jgi:methionyl-tRNA formyltransferase
MKSYPILCIAGKSKVAVESLLFAANLLGLKNVVCYPNLSDPKRHSMQPSLWKTAKDHDIGIIDDFKILKNFQDLIFISLEFDKIINLDDLNTKEIYNIHFSALPKYRGLYTSSLPILNQEKYSGVTLHKIDEGIDTGPIISQKIFQIPQHYTAIELYNRYCDEAIELFKMNFMDLVQKRSVQLYPQDHNDSTYFSKSSINFSKTEIEFAFTTAEVVAKINSLIFPEYQLPTFKGREIIGVQPGVNKIFGPCGLTVKLDNKTDQVFTLDSYVILLYQDN